MSNKYYVYKHTFDDQIVYVGKGSGNRVNSTYGRSTIHKQFMLDRFEEGDVRFYDFISEKLSEEQAYSLERSLIRELKPLYNIYKLKKDHVVGKPKRVYPHLTPREASALGQKKAVEAAKLSPNRGKRGKGKPK